MKKTFFHNFARYAERMAPQRFLLASILLLGIVVAWAEDPDYARNPARGLAIYKEHSFASDSTVVLMEYLSFKAHDKVSYLVTAKGTRLTIPARTTELLLLPYPGKGEATPQEALAVLEYAEERYPSYRDYVRPLKSAWRQEAARPPAEIQQEIEGREKSKENANSFIDWLKGLAPRSEPPKIPPSLLSKTPEKKQPEPPVTEKATEPDPMDFKGNLQKIREFYQATQQETE